MGKQSSSQAHRAGPCKQKNKAHKSRQGFRSKGQIDRLTKGRVMKMTHPGKKKKSETRQQRMNKVEQLRKTKIEQALMKKKSIGFSGTPSHLIAFIPLNDDVFAEDCVNSFSLLPEEEATQYSTSRGINHL